MISKQYVDDMESLLYRANKKVDRLEEKLKEIEKYVDKMSYAEVVDNPKKDLVKILKRSDKE